MMASVPNNTIWVCPKLGGLKKLLGMDPWHIGFGILEALAVAVFQIPPHDFLVYVSSWNDLMLYPN
jgi:hypothetical protein